MCLWNTRMGPIINEWMNEFKIVSKVFIDELHEVIDVQQCLIWKESYCVK